MRSKDKSSPLSEAYPIAKDRSTDAKTVAAIAVGRAIIVPINATLTGARTCTHTVVLCSTFARAKTGGAHFPTVPNTAS